MEIENGIVYIINAEVRKKQICTWFTAGGAIRIAHYDIIDDVITRKL